MTQQLGQTWNAGDSSWVYQINFTSEYNSNNCLTAHDSYQYWNSGTSDFDDHKRYEYVVHTSTLGVENEQLLSSSIYPNPSNGTFTIALDKNYSQATVQVVDLMGKVVFSTTLNQQNNTIDMSKATKSVYFVKVNTNEGTQSITKVVVE